MLRKVESEGGIPRKEPRLLVYPPSEKQKAIHRREPADGFSWMGKRSKELPKAAPSSQTFLFFPAWGRRQTETSAPAFLWFPIRDSPLAETPTPETRKADGLLVFWFLWFYAGFALRTAGAEPTKLGLLFLGEDSFEFSADFLT